MSSLPIHLVTFEEFDKLPDPSGGHYELQHGQIVYMPFRTLPHAVIQDTLADLLKPFARGKGRVMVEFPFRATAEYEYRQADIAFIANESAAERDRLLLRCTRPRHRGPLPREYPARTPRPAGNLPLERLHLLLGRRSQNPHRPGHRTRSPSRPFRFLRVSPPPVPSRRRHPRGGHLPGPSLNIFIEFRIKTSKRLDIMLFGDSVACS